MADEPTNGGPGTRGWWLTLPGVLTAIAGLITAVTGLILALHAIFPGGAKETPSTAASPPAVAGTSAGTGAVGTPAVTPGAAAYRVTFPSGGRARVGDNVYEILAARASRDNPGEVALNLTIRMTNNGRYPANFWDASFRLVVDGVPRAPTSGLDEVVDGQSAKEGTVAFVVPGAARRLVLRVGQTDTVSLPIALHPSG